MEGYTSVKDSKSSFKSQPTNSNYVLKKFVKKGKKGSQLENFESLDM